MSTTANETELGRPQFFINNEWVAPAGGELHDAIDAATEEVIAVAAMATEADMDAAVRAARDAFDRGPWPRMTLQERSAALHRFADELEKRSDFTAQLVTREIGTTIGMSTILNGQAPAMQIRYYADLVLDVELEKVQPSMFGSTIVRKEPLGVAAVIVPWNYPHSIAMFNVAPALAAGCTVVLKPSPETALDSYVLADAARDAGLPAGVLNIVLGGREAGAALVSHPGVDKVAFTGSTEAGRKVGEAAGRGLKHVILELGGKSASIVLEDASMETFYAGIGASSFMNNSQTCTTASRVLAPRSRYDDVVETLKTWCTDQVIGDPFDPAVTMGPMASKHHLARINEHIEAARQTSARLITGGGRPAGLDRGWYVEPTIFADVDNGDRLAREEVFGPVIAVIPYDDEVEALRLANDSDFGLGGVVWSADEQHAIEVARQIRTGAVGINYWGLDMNAPFGGVKASGVGRELGSVGLDNYFEYKSIYASADLLNG
ncbi:aldehyde dehydrogenase [Aeromicrobium fastidiosum]|uniref:Aldehyde dehydrogenase n=1 Tax=Aeromicrobium fastidiosum TaxID=52699 RepID=A0A641AQX5_9ACTN|nr:aldehyde dehydrogenase [Aeromicrobium fastidiosum]KAA1379917.1 aldehyde dehydrogenase [Aeromicrobium fastidiosum]MBP2389423.1 betaine-aldehyde dehydrogenase [Aeromicrobium fastidiosum]